MGKVEIIPGIKSIENAQCAFFDAFTTQYSVDICSNNYGSIPVLYIVSL